MPRGGWSHLNLIQKRVTQNALIQIDNTSLGTITIPWWRGLCVPVTLRAMLSGVCAPGRVPHDQLVSLEGPDEEWFRAA